MGNLGLLGSTIYEMMTSKQPYQDLPDEEVEARYVKHMLPGVEELRCGQVIVDCWRGNIKTAKEAMVLIRGEMDKVHFEVGSNVSHRVTMLDHRSLTRVAFSKPHRAVA
jgi:hypothetical protein